MKNKILLFLLTILILLSTSCITLGEITDLISIPQKSVIVSTPLPPTDPQPQTATFMLITPDEDLSPATNTPAPQVEAPPTETPASTSLNPDGAYVLYGGQDGVWISNPDGSFLTQIYTDAFYNNFRAAVAPDGSKMALVTRDDSGYHLIIMDLPGGQQTYVAKLMDGFGDTQKHPLEDPKQLVEQVLNNIQYNDDQYSNVAWQPGEGRLLAFVGAINADTTDLYIYDTQSQEIKQLTDDPSFAVLPSWSPDGAYILHYGVGWEEPLGGALVGHNRLYGVWTINPDDGQLISMPMPQNISPGFVGWQDDQHYLYCDDNLLRSVDIITGEETEVIQCCCYNEISQSPFSGALLLNFSSDCSEDYGEGIFYLSSPLDTPRKVYDKPAWELEWLPESNVFFAYPEVLISGDGLLTFQQPSYNNSYNPAVSTNGIQAWKIYDEDRQPAVQVYVPGDDDWQTILQESVEVLLWDPQDPGRLLILLGNGRLMTAHFPDFVPEVVGQFGGSVSEAIYVP